MTLDQQILSKLGEIHAEQKRVGQQMEDHETKDDERHAELCRRIGHIEAAAGVISQRKSDNRRVLAASLLTGAFTLGAVVLTHMMGLH